MRLRVARLDPTVPLPSYASPGAAAFDLAAAVDMEVPPGAIRLVGTGLVIEVPPGHFLALIARSSTPLKRGLIVPNGVGVIDSDYRGPADEVKIQVYNLSERTVSITRGDRLAQAMVIEAPKVEWEEVATPSAPTRGGFGSTGG
jgi:dUTP pyrophosphatase